MFSADAAGIPFCCCEGQAEPGGISGRLTMKEIAHMDSLYQALLSLLGGGMSGWIIVSHQKRLDKRDEEERKQAYEELEKMRDQRQTTLEHTIHELAKKIDDHVREDKAEVILNQLKNISGAQASQNAIITGMSGEVKQLLVADGKRSEKLDSLDRYIKGVDASLREHKQQYHPGAKR